MRAAAEHPDRAAAALRRLVVLYVIISASVASHGLHLSGSGVGFYVWPASLDSRA